MPIWAIADIHASSTDPATGRPFKPMDVFGEQWGDHMARLEVAWRESIAPHDTVIIAGDIDWAMHLSEARETLERIDGWPGSKLLVRGNHDYWWSSKTTNRVRRELPPTLRLIHNSAMHADGFNICGTKGSPVPGSIEWTPAHEKVLNRERQRLERSLRLRDLALPTIAALHYPPFYPSSGESAFSELLTETEVSCVVYGHLHGPAASMGPEGHFQGVEYRLVAGDAVGFRPVLIASGGRLTSGG